MVNQKKKKNNKHHLMAKVLLALCLPLHFSSLYWPAYSKC